MSMPVMKRRPMSDSQELEGPSSRSPRASNPWEGERIAELAQLLGRQGDLSKSSVQLAGQVAGLAPGERREPPPLERFITGDFAAIEAGLLGFGTRVEPRASHPGASGSAQAEDSDAFAAAEIGAHRVNRREPAISPPSQALRAERQEASAPASFHSFDFSAIETELLGALQSASTTPSQAANVGAASPILAVEADEGPSARTAAMGDDDFRSRVPLYAIAAIIIAGLVGIGASFVSQTGETDQTEMTALLPDAASEALEPSEPRAFTESTAQASSASADAAGQAAALAPASDTAPRVISLDEPKRPEVAAVEPAAIEPPQPQEKAENLSDPSMAVAPAAAAPVRTVAVRPDGALVPGDVAPVTPAPRAAAAKPQKPAAPQAAAAKPAPTAAGHVRQAQAVSAAKAKPVTAAAKPASLHPAPAATQSASSTPSTPPAPAPAAPGPLGFAQTAVSSITSGAAKLFDWAH